jgi:type IV secretory pathway VirB2 component (pilin)
MWSFMFRKLLFLLAVGCLFSILPDVALASVESSLQAVQNKLIGTILPLAAVLGFVYAGFSYITGNPNARNHLILAIIGAGIGFGASSIVSFIHSLVQ